eukprot:4271941-Pleurochrysis_carterae.AAC.1
MSFGRFGASSLRSSGCISPDLEVPSAAYAEPSLERRTWSPADLSLPSGPDCTPASTSPVNLVGGAASSTSAPLNSQGKRPVASTSSTSRPASAASSSQPA